MINEVSIVALIITSNGETPVSISVAHTLESLDAQMLTANGPNASEMRLILKRFGDAAIDTDVALVYFDGAVLKIGARDFVAPGGITLRRPSDLLTKAIPLSALARATALAANGGAVLVHSSGQNIELIDGVTLEDTAPAPRIGTSPVLFASSTAARQLADSLEALAETDEDIDLSAALGALSEIDGVTISQLPARPAMLRVVSRPEADTVTPDEMAAPGQDTGEPREETSAAALPQVGGEAEAEPVASNDAAPAADTALAPVEAAPQAETPQEDPAGADSAEAAASADEPVAALAEDTELSLDVLRAMQGALARSEKRVLQRHLRNLGFYRGLIDGQFGRQTERAISQYQESIGATVTGVLTPSQLRDLGE